VKVTVKVRDNVVSESLAVAQDALARFNAGTLQTDATVQGLPPLIKFEILGRNDPDNGAQPCIIFSLLKCLPPNCPYRPRWIASLDVDPRHRHSGGGVCDCGALHNHNGVPHKVSQAGEEEEGDGSLAESSKHVFCFFLPASVGHTKGDHLVPQPICQTLA